MALIFDLTLIITMAAFFGLVTRVLKQPLLIAYLATGALLAYLGIFETFNHEALDVFADLGIMFLLFLVGMEINFNSLRLVGPASLAVGLGQVIFTASLGYVLGIWMNFSSIEAAYIAIALTFSSTIIIIKLLSDKKDTSSLYGKISIGMMLVQDMVAILLLIFLGSLEAGSAAFEPIQIALSLGKGLLLFAVVLLLGYRFIPKVFDYFGHSQEMLFLASTAWVFLIVTAVSKLGFTVEIAGFLAGLALARSSEHFQIANKIRPLRDFFILVFFILLGSTFTLSGAQSIVWPIIIFSLFVLIGNPLIVMTIMGIMGYRRRTGFMTGVTVAQISEFSLIVAAMGLGLGHLTQSSVALVTAVGIITITLSTYMIVFAGQIFAVLDQFLKIFEKKKTSEKQLPSESFKKRIVLVGYHRTGKSLLHHMDKKDVLVIDFDPDISHKLPGSGIDHLFGDITDPEIFEKAISSKTNLLISTSPDVQDNLALIKMLRRSKRKSKLVVRAETETDTKILYDAGADYVLQPHLSAGHYLGKTITANQSRLNLEQLKKRDLAILDSHFR